MLCLETEGEDVVSGDRMEDDVSGDRIEDVSADRSILHYFVPSQSFTFFSEGFHFSYLEERNFHQKVFSTIASKLT